MPSLWSSMALEHGLSSLQLTLTSYEMTIWFDVRGIFKILLCMRPYSTQYILKNPCSKTIYQGIAVTLEKPRMSVEHPDVRTPARMGEWRL